MFMMTAKVDKKKILMVMAAIAAVILLFVIFSGDREESPNPQDQPVSISTNEARVQFLKEYGWEVANAPVQTQDVRIPTEMTDVLARYNDLQVSQGFDLTKYAGKTATRYVYRVENYVEATEPVYATVLVYKDRVIGADITDTSANGVVRGIVQ